MNFAQFFQFYYTIFWEGVDKGVDTVLSMLTVHVVNAAVTQVVAVVGDAVIPVVVIVDSDATVNVAVDVSSVKHT